MQTSRARTAKRWPPHVFDYEEMAIVDPDVEDLDVRDGRWLQCKRCVGQTLKTGTFKASAWKRHKMTKRHRIHVAQQLESVDAPALIENDSGSMFQHQDEMLSMSDNEPCSSPVESDQSPRFAELPSIPLDGEYRDQEYLSKCCRGIQRNRMERDRFEKDVREVVATMTSFITEQQDDINELRRAVAQNLKMIEALKTDIESLQAQNLRDALQRSGKNKRMFPYSIANGPFAWRDDDDSEDCVQITPRGSRVQHSRIEANK